MIPFLKAKIWFAFQGLPIEKINDEERLPWSKCSVLTNNIKYILQFERLTETFVKLIDKKTADENQGVTFDEYIEVFNAYLRHERSKSEDVENRSDRNSFPHSCDSECNDQTSARQRGNTIDNSFIDKPIIDIKPFRPDMTQFIKTFDDYAWTLYRTKKIIQLNSQSTLNEGFMKLWLLFITYAIKDENTNNVKIPVTMDKAEAKYWIYKLQETLGSRKTIQDLEIQERVNDINFIEFYDMVQDLFKTTTLNESIINTAFNTLAEEALEGITVKGPLKVDRYVRYCVLKSFVLMIYNSKTEAVNYRTSYIITPETEILAGTNKIQLRTAGQTINTITLESNDIQQLNKWRTGFTDGIFYSKSNINNPAIYEGEMREKSRIEKRNLIKTKRLSMEHKIEEERNVRSRLTESMEQKLIKAAEELKIYREKIEEEKLAKEELLKESELIRKETDEKINRVITDQQLQYKEQLEKLQIIENEKQILNEQLQLTIEEKSIEEQKRTYLEEKHSQAQKMLSQAEDKITSLKKLGEKLEKALEEERIAKEEEETIRNATMALLEEEQLAKVQLEKLLEQQNDTLHTEMQKSQNFAEALSAEKMRISKIAEEKEKLAKQLEDSQQKMQKSGIRVKNLDSKVSRIAENVFGKEDNRIPVSHRGQGFIAEVMVEARTKKCRKEYQHIDPISIPHTNETAQDVE